MKTCPGDRKNNQKLDIYINSQCVKNILNKLQSDIRFRVVRVWILVLFQLLHKFLDLSRVFVGCGPELGAVLTHKP
jgi:hypothetical protein